MEINKSTRHAKITGDFSESLILYWLSKYGFECALVDHTGIDIIARNPHTQELMGISVKSRSRNVGAESHYVSIPNKNFEKVYTVINVKDLEVFDAGTVVDLAAVLAKGLTSQAKHSKLFKVLGDGELTRSVTVKVDAITASAREKIEKAGGTVELIEALKMRPKFVAKDGTQRAPGAPRRARARAVAARESSAAAAASSTEGQ